MLVSSCLGVCLALAGCDGTSAPSPASDAAATDGASAADMAGGAASDMTGGNEVIAGHCSYRNQFSQQAECREYVGAGWMAADVMKDCSGQPGSSFAMGACEDKQVLGRCIQNGGTNKVLRVLLPGTDKAQCAANKMGCEVFAGGTWVPDAVCQ